MKKILLLVDHKKRDLAGIILLANVLKKEGSKVIISSTRQFKELAIKTNVDTIIINHCRKVYKDEIEALSMSGVQIYVLDTEGAVFDDNFTNYVNSFDPILVKYIAGIFTWGETQKKQLELKHTNLKNIIHDTGHPKFEYLSKYVKYKDQKKNILINFSFPIFKSKYSDWFSELNAIANIYNKDVLKVFEKVENQAINYFRLVSLIIELSKIFPNLEFTIRPHPFEDPKEIKKIFRYIKNVHIDEHSALYECINSFDYLLHIGCTTGIEFSIANKISILLNFLIEDKSKIPELTSLIGYKVNSKEELINYFKTFDNSILTKQYDPIFHKSIKISNTSSLDIGKIIVNKNESKSKIVKSKLDLNASLKFIIFNVKLLFRYNDKILNYQDIKKITKIINENLVVKQKILFSFNLFLYKYYEIHLND
jgi:surface carbohydrate biosynthesis protein